MEAALACVRMPNNQKMLCLCLGRDDEAKSLGPGLIRYLKFERDSKRMALYYQASDIYLHASLGESFGKTIAEAMACGTPVIATAVGGIPELLTHGINGFLVEPSNPAEMAQFVEILLSDGPLRSRVGCSAAAHAKEQFGLKMQVDRFLDWYPEVIEDWLIRKQSRPCQA